MFSLFNKRFKVYIGLNLQYFKTDYEVNYFIFDVMNRNTDSRLEYKFSILFLTFGIYFQKKL